jgi:hypothetical protein
MSCLNLLNKGHADGATDSGEVVLVVLPWERPFVTVEWAESNVV